LDLKLRWIYGTGIVVTGAVFTPVFWAVAGGGDWGEVWFFEGIYAALYVLAVLVAKLTGTGWRSQDSLPVRITPQQFDAFLARDIQKLTPEQADAVIKGTPPVHWSVWIIWIMIGAVFIVAGLLLVFVFHKSLGHLGFFV
jgi:hypothetical protein